MDMDWIWSPLGSLQEALREVVGGSSSDLSTRHVPVPLPEKIDDHVYEVCKPDGRPSVEIVFFHGLQLEDYKETYMTTWMSQDKTQCWLRWLLVDFPDARILTVSYDASASRTDEKGRMDMYVTGENLVQSLTHAAQVGQDGCPVLLVGHCLGGLVMKELCYQALLIHEINWADEYVDNFLINVKGFFFYGTPHNGSFLADSTAEFLKGPLLGDLTTLNAKTARSNEIFRKLRYRYRWKTYGIGELLPVKLGNFKGVVVPEASSRHDMDSYYSITADHYNLCKPRDKKSSAFEKLAGFIRSLLKEAEEVSPSFEADSSSLLEPVGLEARAAEVEQKLKKESSCRLGIAGMGGIGKTTLAKAVFNNMSARFEYTCFFEEVKNATVKKEKLEDLRSKIVDRLYHKGRRVNLDRPTKFKWTEMQGKKVLLVLDDVESVNQVCVMTPREGFHKESRLIVTSRNRGFLERESFELHMVEQLNVQDSNTLFCLHAFKDRQLPESYEKRVARLVDKCEGLPLTLKVIGSYLRNQEEDIWDDALMKLSKAESLDGDEDDELWAKLRVSYDSLAAVEKAMFLDVAACFHGEVLDEVKAAWRVCGWGSPNSGWKNLLDRCLVSEYYINPGDISLDYDLSLKHKHIWMHEQLRDLGRAKATHTRVNGIKAACELKLQEKGNKTKVKVLKIVDTLTIDRQEDNVDLKFLGGLTKLKILWLGGAYSCQSFPRQIHFLKICYSNEHFSNKSLTQVSNIQSLRCLILHNQTLTSFPDSFSHLSQLEHLEICCPSLEKLPQNFGNLLSLHRLLLKDCLKLKMLPETWGKLHQLQYLTISGCDELSELSVRQLHALEHLEVMRCPRLTVSALSFRELEGIRHLDIQKCKAIVGRYNLCSYGNPRECVGQLMPISSITSPEWIALKDMRMLPNNVMWKTYRNSSETFYYFTVFQGIKRKRRKRFKWFGQVHVRLDLTLQWESPLITTAPAVGFVPKQLTSLTCNNISPDGDFIMECLFRNYFWHLQGLEVLEISSCSDLTALPEAIGQLQALKTLQVKNCPALIALPESLGLLQALQKLVILHCPELIALPKSLGELQALQQLAITACWSKLTTLPESLGQLQALEQLQISTCSKLSALPESLWELRALQGLEISLCLRLTALSESLGQLQALQQLIICGCPFTSLPKSLGQLRALQRLTIDGCNELTAVPESLMHIQGLQEVTISYCELLTHLPESLLTSLKGLGVRVEITSSPWTPWTSQQTCKVGYGTRLDVRPSHIIRNTRPL